MKRIVTFGEIMLRLSPPGNRRFSQADSFDIIFGGGESNVAMSLAGFGMDSRFVSRLPANDIGDFALADLRRRGLDTSHCVRGGSRIGIYFLEMGAMQRGSKVVYDRENSSLSTIKPLEIDWAEALAGADWFHWSGITPALSEDAAAACHTALATASQMGIPISVDLNYRSKLWQYGKTPLEVMPPLIEFCDYIIGGGFDALKLCDIVVDAPEVQPGTPAAAAACQPACEAFMKRFPRAKKVITTLRNTISASHNRYTAVLWDGTTLHKAPTYDLTHIVDRVGGGDGFAAGLIYGLLEWPEDGERALAFAVAASALKHSVYGDANVASVAEVTTLMAGDGSGRVSR